VKRLKAWTRESEIDIRIRYKICPLSCVFPCYWIGP